MSITMRAASTVETQPATRPKPVETIPADPNDPAGVEHTIIEEIEEIGRRYAERRKIAR